MQALNDHINVEFTAAYAYHALFAYFDRDTVALNGFAKYFKQQADEVKCYAFVNLMNKREMSHIYSFSTRLFKIKN